MTGPTIDVAEGDVLPRNSAQCLAGLFQLASRTSTRGYSMNCRKEAFQGIPIQ
jgi:hypothetical protein